MYGTYNFLVWKWIDKKFDIKWMYLLCFLFVDIGFLLCGAGVVTKFLIIFFHGFIVLQLVVVPKLNLVQKSCNIGVSILLLSPSGSGMKI